MIKQGNHVNYCAVCSTPLQYHGTKTPHRVIATATCGECGNEYTEGYLHGLDLEGEPNVPLMQLAYLKSVVATHQTATARAEDFVKGQLGLT